MSALAVSATKSAGSKAHDLLATMASGGQRMSMQGYE